MRHLIVVFSLCLGALGCTASRVKSAQMQQLRAEPTSCAAVPSTDSTIYDTTQVSEKPVPRTVPAIEYPAEARSRRAQGRAVVTAIVSPDGSVEQPSVEITQSAHVLLDPEARRVVSLATFWPGCHDGAAVRTRIAVPFDFTVTGSTAGVAFGVLVGVWAGVMGAMMQ